MPNIEIYGEGFPGGRSCEDIREEIRKIYKQLGLENEGITDIKASVPTDNDGKAAPYIRLCASSVNEATRIYLALKENNIGVDIEVLYLVGFTPAKEMVQSSE